ncbi:hypothetical protein NDK37_12435 [Xanthomonas citri pv. glycines]|uniref:hypothetical protein n=1 Tax=Xanthomonas citri TaxID=346 RepID=UPI00037526C4|nr:hypothetical protein [Xanthomonas citri]ARV23344.1 hypothetical protein A9D66_12230 [Xanthomonas citri pv. glycines str. 12-2]WLA18104.1 hypothetical protein NDK37_12435 [Xanthomonas citri pv. glycines]
MSEQLLCVPVIWKLCEQPDAWSVWAAFLQAFLAALAIFFAARLAAGQEKRAVARKTDIFVQRILQAAMQAGAIKTFFLGNAQEEPRELVYSAQAKIFELYGQSLRSVPLENVVDARLLIPLHNAAASCEMVADLLKKEVPEAREEVADWFDKLGIAQHSLFTSYNQAFAVQAEFDSTPLTALLKRKFREFRMTRIRGFH